MINYFIKFVLIFNIAMTGDGGLGKLRYIMVGPASGDGLKIGR